MMLFESRTYSFESFIVLEFFWNEEAKHVIKSLLGVKMVLFQIRTAHPFI